MKKIFAILFVLLIATLVLASCQSSECTHESSKEVVTAATCSKSGMRSVVCDSCGVTLSAELIPTTKHDFEEKIKVDSTCTDEGYVVSACKACGTESYETIKIKEHALGEWTVETPETCTEDGSAFAVCADCEHVETKVIEAHHFWDDGVVTEPTCLEGGYTTHTCTVEGCDGLLEDNQQVALGHTEGAPVVENMTLVSCTVDAAYDSVVYCTTCGEELSRETIVIVAAYHQPDKTIETVTAPTCIADGYTTYTCSEECGYYEVIVDEGSKEVHDIDWEEVILNPTCTEEGVKAVWCSCGRLISEPIDKVPHSYDTDTVVDPTDKATGYTIHTCDCGDFYIDTYVSTVGSADLEFVNGVVSCGSCVDTVVVVPLNKDGVDVVAIADKAFINTGITEIYLTTNVATIGEAAFAYSNLGIIHYEGTVEQWNAIEKHANWDLGTGAYLVICIDGEIAK